MERLEGRTVVVTGGASGMGEASTQLFVSEGARAGRPIDIARAALWPASVESSFVTGQSIVVDGGWTASAKEPRELTDRVAESVRDGSNRG